MTAVVTAPGPIDPMQLTNELGGISIIVSEDEGGGYTITCHDESVTQETLAAVVEGHTPAPPPPSEDARLQAQIDELTDLLLSSL